MVAPSYKPLIVRVAMRIGSTCAKPSQVREIALTILLRSTDSKPPLRFRTCIPVVVGSAVELEVGACGVAVWDMCSGVPKKTDFRRCGRGSLGITPPTRLGEWKCAEKTWKIEGE